MVYYSSVTVAILEIVVKHFNTSGCYIKVKSPKFMEEISDSEIFPSMQKLTTKKLRMISQH